MSSPWILHKRIASDWKRKIKINERIKGGRKRFQHWEDYKSKKREGSKKKKKNGCRNSPGAAPKANKTHQPGSNQRVAQQGRCTLHKHSAKWFSIHPSTLCLFLGNGLTWANRRSIMKNDMRRAFYNLFTGSFFLFLFLKKNCNDFCQASDHCSWLCLNSFVVFSYT